MEVDEYGGEAPETLDTQKTLDIHQVRFVDN